MPLSEIDQKLHALAANTELSFKDILKEFNRLIEANANPTSLNGQGQTILHVALLADNGSCLYSLTMRGPTEDSKYLDNDAFVDAKDNAGNSALSIASTEAAKSNSIKPAINLFFKSITERDMNEILEAETTPEVRLKLANRLLDANVPMGGMSFDYKKVLHFLIEQNDIECTNVFIQLNQKNLETGRLNFRDSLIEYGKEYDKPHSRKKKESLTPLQAANRQGRTEIVDALLNAGAKIPMDCIEQPHNDEIKQLIAAERTNLLLELIKTVLPSDDWSDFDREPDLEQKYRIAEAHARKLLDDEPDENKRFELIAKALTTFIQHGDNVKFASFLVEKLDENNSQGKAFPERLFELYSLIVKNCGLTFGIPTETAAIWMKWLFNLGNKQQNTLRFGNAAENFNTIFHEVFSHLDKNSYPNRSTFLRAIITLSRDNQEQLTRLVNQKSGGEACYSFLELALDKDDINSFQLLLNISGIKIDSKLLSSVIRKYQHEEESNEEYRWIRAVVNKIKCDPKLMRSLKETIDSLLRDFVADNNTNIRTYKLLLDELKADPNAKNPVTGDTSLHIAVRENNLTYFNDVLFVKESGYFKDVAAINKQGNTIFHLAASTICKYASSNGQEKTIAERLFDLYITQLTRDHAKVDMLGGRTLANTDGKTVLQLVADQYRQAVSKNSQPAGDQLFAAAPSAALIQSKQLLARFGEAYASQIIELTDAKAETFVDELAAANYPTELLLDFESDGLDLLKSLIGLKKTNCASKLIALDRQSTLADRKNGGGLVYKPRLLLAANERELGEVINDLFNAGVSLKDVEPKDDFKDMFELEGKKRFLLRVMHLCDFNWSTYYRKGKFSTDESNKPKAVTEIARLITNTPLDDLTEINATLEAIKVVTLDKTGGKTKKRNARLFRGRKPATQELYDQLSKIDESRLTEINAALQKEVKEIYFVDCPDFDIRKHCLDKLEAEQAEVIQSEVAVLG